MAARALQVRASRILIPRLLDFGLRIVDLRIYVPGFGFSVKFAVSGSS